MAERIAVRSYRLAPRKPSFVVDDHAVVLRVPTYFGRRLWSIPIEEVAVVADLAGIGDQRAEAFFVRGVEVPTLVTTSPALPPNLILVFAEAQRVPPVRHLVSMTYLDIGWLGSRSARGEYLDGVGLRVVDPDAARVALRRAGVPELTEPVAWLAARREVTDDPAAIAATLAQVRRATWARRFGLAFYALAFALLFLRPDPFPVAWSFVVAAVAGAGAVVRQRVRWWHPRRQP